MEVFDELYEKVYDSETQSQKEKHETELKKASERTGSDLFLPTVAASLFPRTGNQEAPAASGPGQILAWEQ